MVLVHHEPDGGGLAHRQVYRKTSACSDAAALRHFHRAIDHALDYPELRLGGDIADGASFGSGSEQCSLRSAQHFDTIEIEKLQVGRKQGDRDGRLVEIDADLFLHSWLMANDLTRADAANRNLTLPGAQVGNGQARDIAREIGDVTRPGIADLFL